MKLFTNLENLAQLIYEQNVDTTKYFYRSSVLYQGYKITKKQECNLEDISNTIRRFPLSGFFSNEHIDMEVKGDYKNNNLYAILYKHKDERYVRDVISENGIKTVIEDDEELPSHKDSKNMYVVVHGLEGGGAEIEIIWDKWTISTTYQVFLRRYQDRIYKSGIGYMMSESFEWEGVKDYIHYGDSCSEDERLENF